MRLRYSIPYILTACLISAALIVLFRNYDYRIIYKVTFFDLAVSLLIALLTMAVSGLQYFYFIYTQNNRKLHWSDIFLLPSAMRLWSYLIPIKGGLIYSVAYLNLKYNLTVLKGFSVGIYLYLTSLFLIGLIGMYIALANRLYFSLITMISLLFLAIPLIIIFGRNRIKHLHRPNNWLLKKAMDSIIVLLNDLEASWRNMKTTSLMMALNVLHTILNFTLYYWASVVFDLSLSALSILMLTLILKLSIIFRFTPGNLGMEQLVSGGAVGLLGGNISDGILLSLFVTFTITIIAFTLGTFNTLSSMKYFRTKSFRNLLFYLKSSEHP